MGRTGCDVRVRARGYQCAAVPLSGDIDRGVSIIIESSNSEASSRSWATHTGDKPRTLRRDVRNRFDARAGNRPMEGRGMVSRSKSSSGKMRFHDN
jgi:hypothetical protein